MKLSLAPLVAVVGWASLLTTNSVSGAIIEVTWTATQATNPSAVVGDTIRFNWNVGIHSLWRHPSGTCITTGSTMLAAAAPSSTIDYTLTSSDVGTVTFACQEGLHCSYGQISTVTVSETSSPEPSPSPAPTNVPSNAACFSNDTKVNVLGKGLMPIQDIQVEEDHIQVATGEYQPVYALGHFEPKKKAKFVRITTTTTSSNKKKENRLELTPDHMLYLQDIPEPIPAGSVQVGDILRTYPSSEPPAKVTKVSTVTQKGIFAPFVQDGTLVVNGYYVASAYAIIQKGNDHDKMVVGGIPTPFTQHFGIHLSLSPLRLWCRYGIHTKSVCDPAMDGLHPFVQLWLNFIDWAEQQPAWVQWMLFTVVFLAVGFISLVECVLGQLFVWLPSGLMMMAAGGMVAFTNKFCVQVDKKKVA